MKTVAFLNMGKDTINKNGIIVIRYVLGKPEYSHTRHGCSLNDPFSLTLIQQKSPPFP